MLQNQAYLPYSGLFSLGANFPEWARDSGKIYAGLLIRFNCGFNVAIAIMVLYVDEWNASIALSKEHANQILGSI